MPGSRRWRPFNLPSVGARRWLACLRTAHQFVLAPRERGDLGLALARLVGAGFEVVGCHQPQSELEEAFLLLTSEAAA